MKIKIELLAENDERKIYLTNSKFIKVVYEKEEKSAKAVIDNFVIHELDKVETDEEIEDGLNHDIIDIVIKGGAILGNQLYNNTKNKD